MWGGRRPRRRWRRGWRRRFCDTLMGWLKAARLAIQRALSTTKHKHTTKPMSRATGARLLASAARALVEEASGALARQRPSEGGRVRHCFFFGPHPTLVATARTAAPRIRVAPLSHTHTAHPPPTTQLLAHAHSSLALPHRTAPPRLLGGWRPWSSGPATPPPPGDAAAPPHPASDAGAAGPGAEAAVDGGVSDGGPPPSPDELAVALAEQEAELVKARAEVRLLRDGGGGECGLGGVTTPLSRPLQALCRQRVPLRASRTSAHAARPRTPHPS